MSASESGTHGAQSPFELPAMADAYPLDQAERQTIDELLDELRRERADGTRDSATRSAPQGIPA